MPADHNDGIDAHIISLFIQPKTEQTSYTTMKR